MDRPDQPEKPEDTKKRNDTAAIKVVTWKDLSIDELLSIRNTLKSRSEDLTLIDKELKSRIC